MSREVHFVIAVDVDNKLVRIDGETHGAKFEWSEGYFDTDKQEWFPDKDDILYSEALKILNANAKLEDD